MKRLALIAILPLMLLLAGCPGMGLFGDSPPAACEGELFNLSVNVASGAVSIDTAYDQLKACIPDLTNTARASLADRIRQYLADNWPRVLDQVAIRRSAGLSLQQTPEQLREAWLAKVREASR